MTQPVPPPEAPPPVSTAEAAVITVAAIAALEAAIASVVLAAYTLWLAAVTAAVLAVFTRFGLPPDASAIWSTVPLWQRQVDRLLSSLETIARRGWQDTARQLGVDLPFNPGDPILRDVLERTRNLMVRTPDEVYRRVIDELAVSVAAGERPSEAAGRVRRLLDVAGVENWPARARTVAATEVHRAYNFGALSAALRVGVSVVLVKRWLSRDDAAVRAAHRRADGQAQLVGQPFVVGGEALSAPGDPTGTPSNVINCRCKMVFGRR